MNATGVLLWVILPYVYLTLVAGVIWRCLGGQIRLDHALIRGTRAPLARLGSPMFHFGLLAVAGTAGFMGLLIPKTG